MSHHYRHHSQNVCSADVDVNEFMCVSSNQEELLRLQKERGGAPEDRRQLEAELQVL